MGTSSGIVALFTAQIGLVGDVYFGLLNGIGFDISVIAAALWIVGAFLSSTALFVSVPVFALMFVVALSATTTSNIGLLPVLAGVVAEWILVIAKVGAK